MTRRTAARAAGRADRQGAARPLAHADLPGGTALRPDRRALRHRRADQRRAASAPMSSSSWCRPSAPATSSSWTISAATRARPCAALIRAAGAKLFFLPPYSPTSTRSSRSSPSSRPCCAKPTERTIEATWRRHRRTSSTLHPTECANYFTTPDTLQHNGSNSSRRAVNNMGRDTRLPPVAGATRMSLPASRRTMIRLATSPNQRSNG